jgi:hypothetical protein
MDWYGSGNQDPDEFEKLITAIAMHRQSNCKSRILECSGLGKLID